LTLIETRCNFDLLNNKKGGEMKNILIKTCVIILFLALFSAFSDCKKDEKDQSSNTPEIVGCNSVKYQGYTFSNMGCEPGIASFDLSITENGHSADFHVTCSGGCVSSVTINE
jgi:hypothetical protein